MGKACSTNGGEEKKKKKKEYMIFVKHPEGKRPLERPRRRWEDNIRMNLREVGWVLWTGLIWLKIGTVEGPCEHGNKPSGTIKCWEILE
jgi:hypothetical protein